MQQFVKLSLDTKMIASISRPLQYDLKQMGTQTLTCFTCTCTQAIIFTTKSIDSTNKPCQQDSEQIGTHLDLLDVIIYKI
jgi:hypothetical protein